MQSSMSREASLSSDPASRPCHSGELSVSNDPSLVTLCFTNPQPGERLDDAAECSAVSGVSAVSPVSLRLAPLLVSKMSKSVADGLAL